MARPRTSLLARCCERSFRPRHHWMLLAAQPELPLPSLAELQREAQVSDPDRQRALARVFKQKLDRLDDQQHAILEAARRDREQLGEQPSPAELGGAAAATMLPPALADRLAAAVAELLERTQVELTAAELLHRDLLVAAVERLDDVRAQIARDGVTVAGSRGQQRAHPLLPLEAKLIADLDRRMREFTTRVNRRSITQIPTDQLLLSLYDS